MRLEPVCLTVDHSDVRYQQPECGQLLDMYREYYPKVGFERPWIGYFIWEDNKMVVTCSFNGPPQNGSALNITARTEPQKNASTRILKKNGFTFSGIVQDEEIDADWLWVKSR